MDDANGIFPRQAYGVDVKAGSKPTPEIVPTGELKGYVPLANHQAVPAPLAVGKRLAIAPESDELRMVIESHREELQLLDGRVQHQNGWFVVRSKVAAGATKGAIHWLDDQAQRHQKLGGTTGNSALYGWLSSKPTKSGRGRNRSQW